MTKSEILEKIAEIDKQIVAAAKIDEKNHKNWAMAQKANKTRFVEVYEDIVDFYIQVSASLSYDEKEVTMTFELQDKDKNDFQVTYNNEGKIVSVCSHSLRASTEESIHEFVLYHNAVKAIVISQDEIQPKIAKAFAAIKGCLVQSVEKTEYELKNEKELLLRDLKIANLNLVPGSVVMFNNGWYGCGRWHDSWKEVRVIRTSPKMVTMVGVDDPYEDSFRRQFDIRMFRTKEEHAEEELAEKKRQEDLKARWNSVA